MNLLRRSRRKQRRFRRRTAVEASASQAPESVKKKRRPRLWAASFLGAVAALVAALSVVSGSGRTPVDRYELNYGSSWPGAGYQGRYEPGSGPHLGRLFGDRYGYPADVWTYQTTKAEPILATSKDGIRVSFQATAYSRVDPRSLREFHERIGYSRRAYTVSGWNRTVRVLIRPELESVLREATQKYSVEQLWAGVSTLSRIESSAAVALPRRLELALGGSYFCGPRQPAAICGPIRIVLSRPGLPGDVQAALERNGLAHILPNRG